MLTRLLRSIAEDIRFALRMMKRSLALTAMAVLSLALGIGATISIFSVIYALALRSLPVLRPDPLSLGFAIALVLLVAGIAAFLPARRAMRVSPMVALR